MPGALAPMSMDETQIDEPELPFDRDNEAAEGEMPKGGSNDQFRGMLVQRLATLSPEEKQTLDMAITPQVASVLSKVLPELGDIIAQVAEASASSEGETGGALGALGGQ